MRAIIASAIFILMSTLVPAQTLSAPQAVTDPKQLKSRTVTDLQQFTIEKLYMTRQIGSTAWSPDGKHVVFVSNISGRNNLWTIPATGGWPLQLTISDQRQTSPAWSPDGKWVAYMSDYDGDEQWDIFLVSPVNGDVVNLTLSRETAEEDPAWSPDGARLAYSTKPKVAPNAEIDVVDVLTRKTVHITRNTPKELSNSNPVWSHDGKWLAFTQSRADGKDSNIFLAELATGKLTNLTQHEGEHNYYASDFSPDGRKLLITSDAANDYENVGLLDISTKQIEWLTRDKWEISAHGFSPDGKQVVWTANVDGLRAGSTSTTSQRRRAELLPVKPGVNSAGGSESAFTRDGAKFLYYHNGADSPNDAWAYDVKTRQVYSADQLSGCRPAHGRHGGAHAGSLPEQGWQAHHLRLGVHAE